MRVAEVTIASVGASGVGVASEPPKTAFPAGGLKHGTGVGHGKGGSYATAGYGCDIGSQGVVVVHPDQARADWRGGRSGVVSRRSRGRTWRCAASGVSVRGGRSPPGGPTRWPGNGIAQALAQALL